jgi:DNA-directed RNA polymerase specialized sigma24 family protein
MHLSNDNMPDAALVARVLAGEREAFSMLAERYYISVLKLCARLLGSVPEAQDIAQEAVLQAFLHLGRLHEPARFGAWLHAIAANLARMSLRRRRPLSLDALTDNSYAELAELLGVPVSTVKGRLFKGSRQLRQTLAPIAQDVLKPDRRE